MSTEPPLAAAATSPPAEAPLAQAANGGAAAGGGGAPLALTALHEILSSLAHDASNDQVFATIAEKALLLTGASSSLLALLEPNREEVTFAAVAGGDESAAELKGARVRVADTVVGNTARTGEPYLAFRPEPKGGSPVLASPPLTSAAVVPVFVGGAPSGALAALNKGGGTPFGGEDMLALSALSAAVSATLVGSQRRDESQRQSRELSVLYDAVRNVAGHLSVQDVLRAVVRQVRAHIDAAAVVVYLLNDERTHLYVAEDDGLTDAERENMLPADAGLGGAALSAPRPLFLSFAGPDDDALPQAYDPPFPGRNARSGIAAAVRSGETVHGVVLALSGQAPGEAYSLADANLLSALAAQAAVAIENAYLYEDATRRAEEAAALYELSQAVTSTLRLEDVLERVADSVLSLLSVDRFALFLRDRDGERLRLVMGRGLADGAAERLRPLVGQGIPGWVLEFETPTGVQDVAADHRNASAPLHTEGVASMACMPLQTGNEAIGVLCAMSSRRRQFTIAEMELLYTIANQASVAIENARVYEDVRQKGRELRKYFHRVARALGSAHSPAQVPHLIASLTLEVMGADRCAVYALHAADGFPRLTLAARAGFRLADEPEGSGKDIAGAPAAAPLPVADTAPAGWAARRARALSIDDLAEENRFDARYLRPARGRAASYLAVPLRSGREVVGVLEVFSRTRRVWQGEDMRLLLTFAAQAAVAFANARRAAADAATLQNARLTRRLLAVAASPAVERAEQVVRAVHDETGLTVIAARAGARLAAAGDLPASDAAPVASANSPTGVELTCFSPGAAPSPTPDVDLLTAAASLLDISEPA
jgi:GAF domain-containing protein